MLVARFGSFSAKKPFLGFCFLDKFVFSFGWGVGNFSFLGLFLGSGFSIQDCCWQKELHFQFKIATLEG